MKTLTFYFDYLSPFSYFALLQKDLIPAKIVFKPIALGPVLNHWQMKGPGEIDPKREFLLRQCMRYASENKVVFSPPKSLPFNSLYALRLSLECVAGENQERVIETLFKAGWQNSIEMSDPDILIQELNKAGLNGNDLYEKSFSKEAKTELKANINEAIAHGVFGVPSFIHEGELFWGNDSIKDLIQSINGRDSLDKKRYAELLSSTPKGASQSLKV